MNTRSSAKKVVYSEFASTELEQPKTNARSTISSDAEDDENINDAQFEKFLSPTFNIHIHVPYYDTNNSKVFLPRIQPVINLHFDELARKLENNRNIQNEKSFSKTFQNLVPQISPKFGVVKVHFTNNSEERDTEDADLNNVTSLLEEKNFSQRHSYDKRKKKVKSSNNVQNVTAEISEEIVNNNNNYNTSSSSNSNNSSCSHKNRTNNNNIESETSKSSDNSNCVLTSCELDKDIKLKKAVVMLTDICKSKNYKHFFENNSFCKNQNNENESSSYFEDKFENNCSDKQKYEGMCSLKMEIESFASESFTNEWKENNFDNPENYFSNDNAPSGEDVNFRSNIEKICNEKDQNFTALVEGWSFSDILNRFQLKYSEKLNNCKVPFSSKVIRNRNSNDDLDNDSKLNLEINKVINKTEYVEEDFEKEHNVDDKLHLVINKNEIHLNEEDCFDETVSDDTESYSFVQNETTKDEMGVLSEGSMYEFQNLTKEDFGPEFILDSVKSESDECKITPEKEVSSKGTVDMEIVEHDVSSNSSIDIQEIKFEVPETNKSSLLNVTHPKFHLELIKKEMQRRALSSTPINKTQKNLKSNQSNKSSTESPPPRRRSSSKKMKLSNGKPKTPEQNTVKSSQTGDFISLNPYGPTEFSVAALNKISPSTSKAKDFKENMLFGNRVNRFSSPDQLRIYQLKKEAARKSLKH